MKMELRLFKETLYKFLNEVSTPTISKDTINRFIEGDRKFATAPNNYYVLNEYLLVKDRTKELNEKLWLTFKFFTTEHAYTVSCVLKKNGGTYMGCIGGTRKSRAGEDWWRGNDLPDGKFSLKTWQYIKNAIIRYEMDRLSNYIANGHHANPVKQEDK